MNRFSIAALLWGTAVAVVIALTAALGEGGVLAAGDSPAGGFYYASAWDTSRDRYLLHGGADGTTVSRELWAYSPATDAWTLVSGNGPARSTHSGAVDPASGNFYIFGGTAESVVYNDLWRWDGTVWATLDPSGDAPAPTALAATTWDTTNRQLLVFGGYAGDFRVQQNFDALYAYRPATNTWVHLQPENAGPGARQAASAVWDPVRQQMLIFGGWDFGSGSSMFSDLWAYAPATNRWTQLKQGMGSGPATPENPIPGRFRHAAAWDPGRERMIVFAGCCGGGVEFPNDTWAYYPADNRWEQITPGGERVPGRNRVSGAWDPVRERLIVFGGIGECFVRSDLWAYSARTGRWDQLALGALDPLARMGHSLVWDGGNGRALMFGGCNAQTYTNDVWEMHPATAQWTLVSAHGKKPQGRYEHSAVWDDTQQRMLVFGGASESGKLGDLWSFVPNTGTWTKLTPAGLSPAPRFGQGGAWDPLRRRMLMYGGEHDAGFFGDLWAFNSDSGAWTDLHPTGNGPPPLQHPVLVYDTSHDQLIVYSGWSRNQQFEKQYPRDIWIYRPGPNSWRHIPPEGAWPQHLDRTSAAWDAQTGRMHVFSGLADEGISHLSDELWSFEPTAGTWARVQPSGSWPPARYGLATVFAEGQLIVLGGYSDRPLRDLWAWRPGTRAWVTGAAIAPPRPPMPFRVGLPFVGTE